MPNFLQQNWVEYTDDDWKNFTGPWNLDTRLDIDNKEDNIEQMSNDIEEEIDQNTIYTGEKCSEINILLDIENEGPSDKKLNINNVEPSFGLKDYSSVVKDISKNSKFIKLEIDDKTENSSS